MVGILQLSFFSTSSERCYHGSLSDHQWEQKFFLGLAGTLQAFCVLPVGDVPVYGGRCWPKVHSNPFTSYFFFLSFVFFHLLFLIAFKRLCDLTGNIVFTCLPVPLKFQWIEPIRSSLVYCIKNTICVLKTQFFIKTSRLYLIIYQILFHFVNVIKGVWILP